MNDIKPDNRPNFFPKGRKTVVTEKPVADPNIKSKIGLKSGFNKQNKSENDSKVEIPQLVKDFSRIKKAVDSSPDISNEKKIQDLKSRIKNGEYEVNYDTLAQKILDKKL